MWVPRQQDLTMMGTNGCHSAAPPCSQTALFVLTNHKSPPLKSRAAATATGRASCRQTSIAVPFLLLLFLAFFSFLTLFFLYFCCQVGFEACKWHNHVSHFTVCSVYLLHHSKRKKNTVVFQYNLFILKSRMMRHL